MKDKEIYTLTIEVIELKNDEGSLMLALFDENKNKIAAIKKNPIIDSDRKSFATIDSLNPGKHEVQYWHDKNDNKKLDLGFFGQPKENYGNSNNVQGFMGPPKFTNMIFTIVNDLNLKMKNVN